MNAAFLNRNNLYSKFFIVSFLVYFLFIAASLGGNTAPASSNLKVSLITFGPGETYWERFGHNAILIEDISENTAITYNYGIFDFEEKNFFFNFIRGFMRYRIAANSADDDFYFYSEQGRWIVQQELNLTTLQKTQLSDFLNSNLRPENLLYNYDYFRNNCSTKVRDALNQVLNDELRKQTASPSRGFTYRMDALRLMRPNLLLMLGMDIGLGPLADQRLSFWDESFVPMSLMTYLREVNVRDDSGNIIPLVAKETLLSPARLPEPSDYPPDWFWLFLEIGTGCALLVSIMNLKRKHLTARIVLAIFASTGMLILGVGGLVIAGLWFFTEHQAAWRNENILLFNPLCLLLLPGWIKSFRSDWHPRTFFRTLSFVILLIAGLGFFAKILPWFNQDNAKWIALLLPLQAALTLSMWRQSRA